MSMPRVVLLCLLAGFPVTAKALELTPKLEKSAAIVEFAWQTGRPLMFLEELVPLMAVKNDAQWNAFQKRLRTTGVVPLEEALPRARMILAQQDLWSEMPRPAAREVDMVVPALRKRIDSLFTNVKAHLLMRDPLPVLSLMEYHQAIHNARLLNDQLETARRLAKYLLQFGEAVPRARYRELNPDARSTLEEDYAAQAIDKYNSLLPNLQQRQIELCLKRFDAACAVLGQPNLSADHLLASVTCEVDYPLVTTYLKTHRPADISRTALKEPRLLNRLYTDAAQVRRETKQPKLAPKMKPFFQALYWWSRGRYGVGAEAWGLVKSETALRSIEGQFAIYVPPLPLRPTDPVASVTDGSRPVQPVVPAFDRRHHYAWAWENRTLDPRAIYLEKRERSLPWSCQVAPELRAWAGKDHFNSTIRAEKGLLRLVGYVEYVTALRLFGQTLPLLSAEELAAAEALIRLDDQYMVYVNLSRRFAKHANSSLVDPVSDNKNHARHGLPWMMALARVEVHAMHAAFTNASQPFQLSGMSEEEHDAYFRILVDAMNWHYFALGEDPVLRFVSDSNVPDQVALAYQRRIKLVLQIVGTIDSRADRTKFSKQQHFELESMKATMLQLSRGIDQEVKRRIAKRR